MKKSVRFILLFSVIIISLYGCGKKLPIETDLAKLHFKTLNQDSSLVAFPDYLKGKVFILSLIYTNCPDVCPLIVNNMQRIQNRLFKEKIDNVNFVSISFDPYRDKPSVLKDFAALREIDTKSWQFLTGNQSDIDSLRRHLKFLTIAGDTIKTVNGKLSYNFVHTDRIFLVGKDLAVRKYYKGSEINLDDIVTDIQLLLK
jgi:protein SCO1